MSLHNFNDQSFADTGLKNFIMNNKGSLLDRKFMINEITFFEIAIYKQCIQNFHIHSYYEEFNTNTIENKIEIILLKCNFFLPDRYK